MGEKNGKTNEHRWVGFDLGGTKMLATVFDDEFQVLGRKRKRTRGEAGAELGVDRIVETVKQAMESAGVSAGQLRGIGVGCPGPVDLDHGIVLEAVNLGWQNVQAAAGAGRCL